MLQQCGNWGVSSVQNLDKAVQELDKFVGIRVGLMAGQ